ncbi:hypothetical protein AAE478_003786 [Parahypoxylon ruwenzoriense]
MSADLFAAFEDTPNPPPPQGQPSKTFAPAPPFTSDPLSFGIRNATNTAANINRNSLPAYPQWSINSQGSSQSGLRQNTQQRSSGSGWIVPSSNSVHSQYFPSKTREDEDEDDDGWGDFEVAPDAAQSRIPSAPATIPPPSTVAAEQNPSLGRTRVVRASTMDLVTNNLLDLGDLSTSQSEMRKIPQTQGQLAQAKVSTLKGASQRAPKKTSNANPNVLFDADDFDGQQADGDEDFGEFETVASPAQAVPDLLSNDFRHPPKTTETRTSQMLADLNLTEPGPSYPQAPRSPSFQDRNPFPGLVIAPPARKKKQKPVNEPVTSPHTAWPSVDEKGTGSGDGIGDDWGAFDDFPDEQTKSNSSKSGSNWDWDSVEPSQQKRTDTQAPAATSETKDSSWNWDPIDQKAETNIDQPKDDLPPINIPPPSVLLSVFPQLFDQANTSLYKPVSGQPFSIKNRILSDTKTIEYLKGYLALATVVARIIAGRKLRWHRDKFLTKAMSMSAAGSKGMKLAGVDKAQAAREDREAADVVANWKEHIGRLRSAVAAANSSMKDSAEQLKIPEISESMQIQTEKMVLTAPKACIVCGLKRNERVSKVDYEVEDSFGEWWVDHWGHLACKRFWLRHENALRQR